VPRLARRWKYRRLYEDTLVIEQLAELFSQVVEARRGELVPERQAMLTRLQERSEAKEAEWLHGLDNLLPGTYDMLTVTILFPA
jgi:hypothetical protein